MVGVDDSRVVKIVRYRDQRFSLLREQYVIVATGFTRAALDRREIRVADQVLVERDDVGVHRVEAVDRGLRDFDILPGAPSCQLVAMLDENAKVLEVAPFAFTVDVTDAQQACTEAVICQDVENSVGQVFANNKLVVSGLPVLAMRDEFDLVQPL